MSKTYCVHEFRNVNAFIQAPVRNWEQEGLIVEGQTLKPARTYQSPSRPYVGNRGWNLLKAHRVGDDACHAAWVA